MAALQAADQDFHPCRYLHELWFCASIINHILSSILFWYLTRQVELGRQWGREYLQPGFSVMGPWTAQPVRRLQSLAVHIDIWKQMNIIDDECHSWHWRGVLYSVTTAVSTSCSDPRTMHPYNPWHILTGPVAGVKMLTSLNKSQSPDWRDQLNSVYRWSIASKPSLRLLLAICFRWDHSAHCLKILINECWAQTWGHHKTIDENCCLS